MTCTVLAYLGQTWTQALTPAQDGDHIEPRGGIHRSICLDMGEGTHGAIGRDWGQLILAGIFLAELRTKL